MLSPSETDAPSGMVSPIQASFSWSVGAVWLAIGTLWSVTPLCYLYVLWTLATLTPCLASYRPAAYGALRGVHYVLLSYCALEIPFSIYYRYLAIRANAVRPTPQYTRKFLRDVFKKSLQNGLDTEGEDPLGALSVMEIPRELRKDQEEEEEEVDEEEEKKEVEESLNRRARPVSSNDSSECSTSSLSTPIGRPPYLRKRGFTFIHSQHPLTATDPRAHDFREFLKLWFINCHSFDQIKRDNISDWVAWSLYGVPYSTLVEERKAWEKAGRPPLSVGGELDEDEEGLEIEGDKLGFVEHCVDMVGARAAVEFAPGRTNEIKVIRLTLDPVKVYSRPLILYIFVWVVQKFVVRQSKLRGFQEVVDGDISYLVRVPTDWKSDRNGPESTRPLLFLHGLGMGLAQYSTILAHLATSEKLKNRPLVVLIQPHISMSFFSRGYLHPPNMETQTAGLMRIVKARSIFSAHCEFKLIIDDVMQRWGFKECGLTVLSHSNGSVVHAWLLKSRPDLVVRSCFVDPVCFCLWEPFVCFNFLYKKARSSMEYLMRSVLPALPLSSPLANASTHPPRYFVSRELGVALVLQRAFNWSSNLLFPSQIPNLSSPYHSAFFLARYDSIVNAERIRTYLRRAGVKEVGIEEEVGEESGGGLKVHGMKHGESMISNGGAFQEIFRWVSAELRESRDGSEVGVNGEASEE